MIRTLAISLLLNGCSILGDKRVAAGCQVADGITSWYAIKHGAVEANPLLSGLSPGWVLAIKLAFAYAILNVFPDKPEDTKGIDKFALGAVSVMGCVPAINNYNVIKGMP